MYVIQLYLCKNTILIGRQEKVMGYRCHPLTMLLPLLCMTCMTVVKCSYCHKPDEQHKELMMKRDQEGIYIYIYMYIYIYVCVYIYIYIYTIQI